MKGKAGTLLGIWGEWAQWYGTSWVGNMYCTMVKLLVSIRLLPLRLQRRFGNYLGTYVGI